MISNLRFSENAPAHDSCSEWGRYKAGSARVFGYTVYRGFLNRVYGILQLKYGYSVYHFFWISGIKYTWVSFWAYLDEFWIFWEFFSGILVYRYPPWPTLTKAMASFYWDDSETVFLVFLRSTSQCYTCQLFLSQMREIFTLLWPIFPETSRRLPKISDELPKTSERCRKSNVRRCSRRRLSTFEAT